LAEAGLVSSNLSLGQHDNYGANFSPDRYRDIFLSEL
jgi:hypothetical protein